MDFKNFAITGGNLIHKGKSLVMKSKEERQKIIHSIHEDIGDSCKSKPTASHRRRDSTYRK